MTSDADARLITSDEQFIRDELSKFRTDVTTALSGFATQEDLDTMVKKVADGAVEAARNAITDLRNEQERWQTEQRDKLDVFITEVRSKLNTFAPLSTVESLRTTVEDSHRHFVAITGGHGEAIAGLKDRLDKFERQTNTSVESIKASTTNIDTRTNVMQNSIMEFIASNKEHRSATKERIDFLSESHQDHKSDLDKVKSEQHVQDMIVRDVEGRVMQGMKRIDGALFGAGDKDKPGYQPGLVAEMTGLKSGLAPFAFLGRHPRWLIMGAGAAYVIFLIVTALILQRPEIVSAIIHSPTK